MNKTSESVFPATAYEACKSMVIKNQYLVQWEDGRYTLEHAKSDDDFRENFVNKNIQNIKYVDRDIEIKVNPHFSSAENKSDLFSWAVDKVQAKDVWALGYRGENIKVGVVDGYLDRNHVQLSSQVAYSAQFNNEINDPSKNRHGTHVSGIIAADGDKGLAVGIAPRSRIVSGQFMNNSGSGSIATAVIAMTAVADQGAKVINLSWGGAPCIENLKSAIQSLSNRGILIVTSAGNEGDDSDYKPTYPAAFMAFNQLNIASSGSTDLLSYFSNRGYKTVNLAAPGENIISTVPGNNVESMDGTSMAAPLVAGSAALLMSAFPQATAQQIKNSLLRTVDIVAIRNQTQSGGRLNVYRAYQDLKNTLQ